MGGGGGREKGISSIQASPFTVSCGADMGNGDEIEEQLTRASEEREAGSLPPPEGAHHSPQRSRKRKKEKNRKREL